MSKERVIVACRLPNGVVLVHPKNSEMKVVLEGSYGPKTNTALYVPPRPYGTTDLDAEVWAEFKAAYASSKLFTDKIIFEAKSLSEVSARARELEKEKTGLEAMEQTVVMDGAKLEKSA